MSNAKNKHIQEQIDALNEYVGKMKEEIKSCKNYMEINVLKAKILNRQDVINFLTAKLTNNENNI